MCVLSRKALKVIAIDMEPDEMLPFDWHHASKFLTRCHVIHKTQ